MSIKLNLSSELKSEVPKFELFTSNGRTGIVFTGIPGGHEFTSLIVAILNADGKGKLPDDGIQKRIRATTLPLHH